MSQIRCFFLAACCIVLVCAVNSNVLVKLTDDKLTKDIEVPHDLVDDIDEQDLTKLTNDLDDAESDKKCAAVGEFCTYHDDCCTFACLGYMKRCVTGSG